MADWYCFKCREKMEKGKVKLGFRDVDIDEEALVCPKCRVAYITEETVVERLSPTEDMLEEK